MPWKTWILDKVNRVNELFVRSDLPPRPEEFRSRPPVAAGERRHAVVPGGEHLGIYAPLIEAIRDELARFIVTHVQHHLAIAEHDRFLLTGIEVEADEGGESLELLLRFTREFRPEQIKRFLMREVVGGLPNASAIDLSQFAGLRVPAAEDVPAQQEDEYAELLKVLGNSGTAADCSAYRVGLNGRWIEGPAPAAASRMPAAAGGMPGSSPTPVAGAQVEIDIGDAQGERRMALPAVLPGRRYVVGKDEGCDIVVQGTYTSRRHCEIWFDRGAWWVLDVGSTNGIRVESARGVQRSRLRGETAGRGQAIEWAAGERLVLSASTQGTAQDYPWLALRPHPLAAAPLTPIAAGASIPGTPVTPIVATTRPPGLWTVTLDMASGRQSLALEADRLPVSVGRSRSRTLVVDRVHESVSGHHLDIVALDEGGAEVVVHGSNGVRLGGQVHGPGSRLQWQADQTLQLGQPSPQEPPCTLQLIRRSGASAPMA